MKRKDWVAYLLINVLVSALVSLGILYFYDRSWQGKTAAPVPTWTGIPFADLPAKALEVVVLGQGKLESERIVLRYNGPLALDLSNWRIKDEDGHFFVFPDFVLAAGGAVQIHTTTGQDTPVDLYWGLSQPIWQSGESLTLLDPLGTPRLIYSIP
uniref:Peptidoglycan-binding protein n=1 Tax=uncultured Chloroflexota bacterium TaxID=166587 RepID=H5SK87_9CHLR|nr:peptidoglycan-binding protein [uncultured bacterium]BAL56573.1 peptidoglycan-binding protein [uncultured Chloroflexota bacterium]